MRTLRTLASIGLVVLALAVPPAVRAEDIVSLDGPVTDTTGQLDGRIEDIEAAIESTVDEHGVQVFALFIRTTEDRTAEEFAFETAAENGLGIDDALLLVALDDRTDYIWLSESLDEISDDELGEVITGVLEPGLGDGRYADAIIDAVGALGTAASDEQAPAATPTGGGGIIPGPATQGPAPGDPDAGGGSSGFGLGSLVAIGLIVGGGLLIWSRSRRQRTEGGAAAPGPGGVAAPAAPPVDPVALGRRANALLIATDERIRDAGQEVDFAEAQYGAAAVEELRADVARAREALAQAFTFRQQLDDSIPEDEPTRLRMLQEIVALTEGAQATLDAGAARIEDLRDLERDAPRALEALPGRIQAVEDRLPAAEAAMERLAAYAPATAAPVEGDLEEARKGLAGAREAVVEGTAASAAGERGRMAVATQEAIEGVTGAAELLDGIERLAAGAADAERRLAAELTAASTDLSDATAAVAGRAVADPALDERRRAAELALEAARRAALVRPLDPIEALRLATEAHRLADDLLLGARDAVAAADRLVATAESTLLTASTEVERAATYVASRRRGVGDAARTRLAEAERHLAVAAQLAPTAPARTIEEARRAQALAQEAYRLAQDDFSDWDQGGPGWGQRGSGDPTAEILTGLLGGVIGGALSGGRHGGGWGGSPWGGGFGGGGFGGGGGLGGLGGGGGLGGLGGGGWGRGGSFGGGFGGGGGRGGGGRW